MPEVWGSISGSVKSYAVSPERLAAVATSLRSCVAQALSRGNGTRHSLHASAKYRELHASAYYREYNEELFYLIERDWFELNDHLLKELTLLCGTTARIAKRTDYLWCKYRPYNSGSSKYYFQAA